MFVTPSGIVIEFNLEQSKKAQHPIVVTLSEIIKSPTVDGGTNQIVVSEEL